MLEAEPSGRPDSAGAPGGAQRRVVGSLTLPPTITDGGPLLFRVHYARGCATPTPGSLSLLWSTNTASGFSAIPPSAFSPTLSAAQEEREALRSRLYEPAVPWQTYVHSSMGAHTLQPTGLVLRLGIADLSSSGAPEQLGCWLTGTCQKAGVTDGISPWNRFVPAHVVPGRHSLNGSDYTAFEVRSWGKPAAAKGQAMSRRNATVLFQTTTLT